MDQVRIVIVDDHVIVREGLKALLQQQPDFRIVGEVSTGEEAIEQAVLHKPDLIIMDIRMPGMSGIEACREIVDRLPQTHVILLTSYAEDDLLFAAIRAGAASYVLKRIGTNVLVQTIRAVARGETVLDPVVTEALFRRISQMDKDTNGATFADLSNRELHVLASIANGSTNRQIAGQLFLSEGTVRNYVSSILSKLNLANRAEAAAFAIQHKVDDELNIT